MPTNFGPDFSPRTPEVVSLQTFSKKTEDESKPEQVLKNMIPCGTNIIPRTPFHGGALDKGETNEPQKSPNYISLENKIKTNNLIPCGMNIPRTPFNGKDTTKSVEYTGKSEFLKIFLNNAVLTLVGNQVRVVVLSLPQLTQASFLQKNQMLQNRFLISVTLRWHRVSVACKNQSF